MLPLALSMLSGSGPLAPGTGAPEDNHVWNEGEGEVLLLIRLRSYGLRPLKVLQGSDWRLITQHRHADAPIEHWLTMSHLPTIQDTAFYVTGAL